ncbi:malonyl-CoA decarboxylase [Dasania sp. GY-MA-18]|uniref:Malonyl-CoA decarboxylase n=1 Tax=Dasania phycosphaerae TaxID=2950436 RepID=A0A9J6RLZ0_9GAMM|nr:MULTISPECIES: malonyl-CoA decarboxylase [Dasania]MCR8922963.1 malonyl-CoA decarboxylase [Dasania sp. GY-MA-18]MCZ0865394.1 malonyl-CoA decarboxylase [Dasania phycosphaerae]MCZ0869119.1 malonyl-CoA decarboxylase [Dasania phycosphaerae]
MSFNSWMNSIAEAGRDLLRRSKGNKDEKNIKTLCADLCSNKGEAMGTALACAVVNAYHAMNEQEQLKFFKLLVSDYSPRSDAIVHCADAYKAEPSAKNLQALSKAVEPPRQHLFRRINMSPTGTPTLVGMRADLQKYLKDHDELRAVDNDLKHLLESWFNRGFLKIRSIDWKTPAHILEKLIAYEAVHEMNGWEDLRRRLEDDRRCFAFFHPALEDEPLIFVEVALTHGLATAVQPLLAPKSDVLEQEPADTAIFYSISNCQEGLKGISFGNFLIKQVVMELREELPQLTQFSTLSPIPTFCRWLNKELENKESTLINSKERKLLAQIELENWHKDPALAETLKPVLMRLCAHYLHNEKRGAAPLDPVARFHLGNGARIEQLNWMGDVSKNGLKQSAAILVNYLYKLNKVEENHEAYINDNVVACSKKFKTLID